MERTDKQENNRRRRIPPRILGGLPVAMSAAGADGFLICGRNAFDVPERRCPSYSVAIRFDLIDLPDHNATVDVRAIEARTLPAVVVFHYIRLPGCVDTILVSIFAVVHHVLPAYSDGLNVCVSLCCRSGAGAEPKKGDGNKDKEERKNLPLRRLLVAVSHFTTLSSPGRNCPCFIKTLP